MFELQIQKLFNFFNSNAMLRKLFALSYLYTI